MTEAVRRDIADRVGGLIWAVPDLHATPKDGDEDGGSAGFKYRPDGPTETTNETTDEDGPVADATGPSLCSSSWRAGILLWSGGRGHLSPRLPQIPA
jgi:hypothetical protein